MLTPEGRVKAEIRKYLKEIGAYQLWPVPSGRGKSGVDVHGVYRGRGFAIEIKAEDRPPVGTEREESVLKAVNTAGGLGICVNSLAALKQWWRDVFGEK